MDYVVTAELEPPVEATEMDALQREGVAAILDRQLALVEGVSGPGDADIDVLDYRITVHPDGASVVLALDAPALLSAEEAAATVLDELLSESDPLVGWSVSDSAVRITEDEFNQSLAAASEVGSGESGPGESGEANRDETETALEAAIEEVLGSADPEQDPALDTQHWRDKLTESAEQLRAFDLAAFTPAGGDQPQADQSQSDRAVLAGGALIHAVRVVTDEVFYDELSLAVNNATVQDAEGLLVLEELPPCYEHRYDSAFARSFLLASAAVAARLTEDRWTAPRCVAEALALRLIVNEARVLLEAAELMSWSDSEPVFAAFVQRAFTSTDHEELYEVDVLLTDVESEGTTSDAAAVEAELRHRGLALDQWFRVRGTDKNHGLHPYLKPLP